VTDQRTTRSVTTRNVVILRSYATFDGQVVPCASTDVILPGGGRDAGQPKLALGQVQNAFAQALENNVVAVSMTAILVGLSFFLGVEPPVNVEIGARLGRILGQGNLNLVYLADGCGI
jgi:hypothetical protein